MGQDKIRDLLGLCEARLEATVRTASEALKLIRAAREEMGSRLGDVSAPLSFEAFNPDWRNELLSQVLAALEEAPARAVVQGTEYKLQYRPEDHSYCIGRRRVSLTETERHILDIFVQAMPEPVSREMILEKLYRNAEKPGAGAIDVFVSKLRQKLKLASGGREFLDSVRGKGWGLREEFCERPAATEPAPRA